jgi:NAD(P)-dependent dehydrogenase (short-subunit alcohol dehydrogenase family)
LTVAIAIEPELEGIKVNAVSPGFTRTNLNRYAGTETVEEGAREAVRVALLGRDGPTGRFTRWENETIPW